MKIKQFMVADAEYAGTASPRRVSLSLKQFTIRI